MDKKVLFIIPAYNEESNILRTVNKISSYAKKNKVSYDFVVINDGSTDKTKEICKQNNIPNITLIHNLGIGGAVQTGYKYALDNGYDVAIQFDGDGQHDIKYAKKLIETIDENIDLVIGSRYITDNKSKFQSTFMRRVGSTCIKKCIKLFTKETITDPTSGFRAASKKVIEEFAISYPIEYPEPISIVELLKKKYKIKEIPVNMNKRIGGESSIRAWKCAYYMINVCLSIFFVFMRGDK